MKDDTAKRVRAKRTDFSGNTFQHFFNVLQNNCFMKNPDILQNIKSLSYDVLT